MSLSDQVREHVSKILKVPVSRLNDETSLSDLVTDSFVLVDMVIELQEEFDILLVQEDLKNVKTVGELVHLFESKAKT
jgi:acyl carrier protein